MNAPPKRSAVIAVLMRSFRWTMQLERRQAVHAVALCFAIVAALDIITGPRLSPSMGYVFVECLAAWTLREAGGIAVVLLCITANSLINGFGANAFAGREEYSAAVTLWNMGTRTLTAIMIVLMVATLRHSIDRERWIASTDHLTQSLNRGAFRSRVERVARMARRRRAQLLLVYMDLDGFKAVNDRHGHSAGDLVLRRFADEARARIRAGDLFARVGGDEFCAFLVVERGVAPEQVAESLHARLTEALRATGFDVTCSMGAVVVAAADTMETDRLISLADQAMLEVKRSGKDAIRIAFSDAPEAEQPRSRRAA